MSKHGQGLFHIRKLHLRSISTAKYVTERRILLQSSIASKTKKLKLRKKEVMYKNWTWKLVSGYRSCWGSYRELFASFFVSITRVTNVSWRTTQLNAVDKESEAESDDDTSLYQLFGFSLYVGIKFRKKLFMVGFATITIQVEENGMHLN